MSTVAPLDDGPHFKGKPVERLSTSAWSKRSAEILRRRPVCEARVEPVCHGRAVEVHHVLTRGQGGGDHVDNLLAVCGYCHEWIHRNPADAMSLGLLRKRES